MRYLLTLFAVAIVVCAGVGVFNYQADPYVLFSFDDADAQRFSRVDQFNHMRVTKPWYMREAKASAVVVGSSRSARVHPDNPAWGAKNSYNMSVPGMTVAESLRFIQHAHAIKPLSKLMIGLDYEAYIRPLPVTREGFAEERMASDESDLASFGNRRQYFTDITDSLFSVSALSLSVAATTGVAPPGRRYFKDGTWEIATNLLTGRGGYIYIGKNVILAHENNQLDISGNVEILGDILRFAHENNIETRMFFTPTHVFFVDLWFRLGYEAMWFDFHRDIVALNESVAEQLGAEPFPIWGFSDLPGFVNEPIYRRKNAHKAWYDDGVHARVDFSGKMMQAVWGDSAGFGLPLERNNLEPYLGRVIDMKNQFSKDNSKLVSSLHGDIGLAKSLDRSSLAAKP